MQTINSLLILSALLFFAGIAQASGGPPGLTATIIAPEPVSSILFLVGGAVFGYRHLKNKDKK